MKKIVLLLIAAVGITAATNAQVMFGPMAGLNYSIVSTSVDEGDAPDAATGIGFFIGGMADIEVSDMFSVRPELHFSVRNSTSEFPEVDLGPLGTIPAFEVTSSDYFIELPILANIKPSENFNIHAGPEFAFLIGGKGSSDVEGSEDVTGSDYTEGRNGVEVGLAVGAAYETDGGLGIGARYTRGLTDLAEDPAEGVSTNYNLIQIFASYTLGK